MIKRSVFASVFVLLLLALGQSAQAREGWTLGIGTGYFALNVDGDIGMTTMATEDDRERCLQAGMDDCISKPIKAAELSRVLVGVAQASLV